MTPTLAQTKSLDSAPNRAMPFSRVLRACCRSKV
jgi:hypothetical protein